MVGASVLIVEDDQALLHSMERNLAVRGYVTRRASRIEDAIAEIQHQPPAVLLLDVDLPDGSGWEVLRTLDKKYVENIAVIVVSALRPNPRLVIEFGCFAVLEKPFPVEALLRQVMVGVARNRESPRHQAHV
ncbi:MAG: hypothetical protein NVSMB22_11960 [Chloroflexota bacterium]